MKRLLYFAFVCIFSAVGVVAASFSNKLISAKAALDSAYILMGNQTPLHVEIIGDLDGTGYFVPNDSLWKDVEIAAQTEAEISDLGNSRKQLRKDFIIQGFDSGLYNLPTILYVQGTDTIRANKVTLKVIPVNIDTLTTIHDYADVVSPGRNFFDFVPNWVSDYGIWILLFLIVAALAIYIYVKYLRKGKIPLVPQKKPVPPYEMAIESLKRLDEQHLCEKGQEREFYTRLTDILRVYLSKRFHIYAMEMTTSQIIRSLRENEQTRMSEELMAKVLEVADFVKFAKVRPLPDDNRASFANAVRFVENTKPIEEPVASENNIEKN